MALGAGAGDFHIEGIDGVDEVVLYAAGARSTSPPPLACCKRSGRWVVDLDDRLRRHLVVRADTTIAAPGCCRVVRPHPAYARPAGRTG